MSIDDYIKISVITKSFFKFAKKELSLSNLVSKDLNLIHRLLLGNMIALVIIFLLYIYIEFVSFYVVIILLIILFILMFVCEQYEKKENKDYQLIRYERVKKYLSNYDDYIVNLLLNEIKKKIAVKKIHNPVMLGIIAIVLMPIWESFVNLYFERANSYEMLIDNIILLLVYALVIAIAVWIISKMWKFILKYIYYDFDNLKLYELLISALLYDRELEKDTYLQESQIHCSAVIKENFSKKKKKKKKKNKKNKKNHLTDNS